MATVSPVPPPLGFKLKLRRARKQLLHLRRIVERFKADNPFALHREVDANGSYYLYSLEIAYPPEVILLLADEAIHHMRTVLDHLVAGLVEANGKKVTHAHSFPIRRTKPKGSEDIANYEASLKHIPPEARTLIDSLQPYTRGTDAKSHPLAILARLDNRFKHTRLELLAHQLRMPAVPGIIQTRAPAHGRHSGDVFAKVPVSVNIEKDFEPYLSAEVAFSIHVVGLPDITLDTLDARYNYIRDEVMRKLVHMKGVPRRI